MSTAAKFHSYSPTEAPAERQRDITFLFDAMAEGLVIQDVTGAVVDFNAAAPQVLGITGAELDPADPSFRYAALFAPAREALAGGVTVVRPKVTITDGRGTQRSFSVSASPVVTGSDAASVRTLTVFRDVTAEQRTMIERELARTLDSMPTPVAFYNSELVLVHANARYAKIFDKSQADLRGLFIADVLGPELHKLNQPFIERARAGECVSFEREVRVDNLSYTMFVTFAPDVRDGTFLGFYIFAIDVTRFRSAEKERAKLEARLIASSKLTLLGEMAGGIAHEINNPLSIIGGTASVLKIGLESKRLDEKTLSSGLEKIDLTVQRIAKIIRGLRIFARDADRDPVVSASLETIVGETLELCQEKVRNRGIKLTVDVPPHAILQCNPTAISQILMNVLNNAIDAVQTLPEKTVELRVVRAGERWHVFVTDSGPGIPADVAERIFNPFFTTKPTGKATGLGLSISRGLAEDNQGTLNYVPDATGTCFLLDLPAVHTRASS